VTQREIVGPVHVNGKWLSRPVTGTERYAQEILGCIVWDGALRLVIHVLRDAIVPSWLAQGADVVRLGGPASLSKLSWNQTAQRLLTIYQKRQGAAA